MALSYTGFNDGCNEALDMICVPNEIRMSFQWSRNKISKHTLHKCMDKYDNLQHSVIVHSQWYANELRSSLLSFDSKSMHIEFIWQLWHQHTIFNMEMDEKSQHFSTTVEIKCHIDDMSISDGS